METLSKKETILREKDEAERAESYARKQRRQYLLRFGSLVPLLVSCTKYIILVRVILAIFFTGYIMGDKNKKCEKCSITILPCELPPTGTPAL